MAFQYFLYNTIYDNTLVERSNNSFAPLPPDSGEILIDYFIPTNQPLYLYRESGGTIVFNNEETYNEYIKEISPPPTPEDSVTYDIFTEFSGNTTTEIINLENTKVNRSGDTMTGNLVINGDLSIFDDTRQIFKVDSIDDIVYINTTGLTGLISGDDMGFYADGKGAFGDSVNMGKLRANTPGDIPRSLSLIDTNAVIRVWRVGAVGGDPALEFVWGTGDTPTTTGNAWWDMYLDGDSTPNDAFSIRRRTVGNNEKLRLTVDSAIVPMTTASVSPTTGALTVAGGVGIAGATNMAGLAKYSTDLSGTYDNRTLVDKQFVDTHPLVVLNTTSTGAATTTSTTDTLQTGMQIANVPAGTYLVGYGTSLSHGSGNASIYTNIYVGGVVATGSEMRWKRGSGEGNIRTTHNYSNFVITLATTQTVEIRWRSSTGTATSTNRYLTLLKTSSLI